MFRRLLAVLAVATLAASCSSADTLATVNGEEITKADLYAIYPEYEGGDGVTGEDLRAAVGILIAQEIVAQGAERDYGFVVDDEAISERLSDPPARYASILDPDLMVDGSNEEERRSIAGNTLILDAVAPTALAESLGGYEAMLNDRPDMVTQVCLRFIQVATDEEAEDVLDRLDSGEDFAALADELSLAAAYSGGLLVDEVGECLVSVSIFGGDLTTSVIAADVGEPFGPVPLGDTAGILKVEERVAPASAEELASAPMDFIDISFANEAMSTWRSTLSTQAEIDVAPSLGYWSAVAGAIGAPEQ